MHAMKNCLLGITLLLTIPGLLFYFSLVVSGKRFPTLNEWWRFAVVVSLAEIAHWDANGGPRAWAIASDSMSNPVSQVSLVSEGQIYPLPLPPNTIRKSCDRLVAGLPKGFTGKSPEPTIPKSCLAGAHYPTEISSFISIADPDEIAQYINKTLPAAGWFYEDRLGSAWFFRKNENRLMLNWGSYLTFFISDLSLDLTHPAPRKTR